ncbi:MAG: hypothetical protein DDG60_14015 [Anaerolineae bacterium]|nr:MAG: hypothetical protein DDG60_14015 [Anaerolineae bacterium]
MKKTPRLPLSLTLCSKRRILPFFHFQIALPRSAYLTIFLLLFLAPYLSSCVLVIPRPAVLAPSLTPSLTLTPSPSVTVTATSTPAPTFTPTPLPGDATHTFALSLGDNGYNHLFIYAPFKLPLTRITSGEWNDITPVFSPDGRKLVFASDRNEYWDLYLLDLETAQTERLTDSAEFDGHPSWSPDGLWIVYESYLQDQLDLFILSTTNRGQVLRLTDDLALDQTPVWSPAGRQIAFVSNRTGTNDIWLANLDNPGEDRFVNITNSPTISETQPVWSPDGTRLAWAARIEGQPDSIYVWDSTRPQEPARRIGLGDWPAWSESGNELATRLSEPNQDYLTAYTLDGVLLIPPTPLGTLHGLDWRIKRVTILPVIFQKQAFLTPTSLWQFGQQLITELPNRRAGIVPLRNVQAPHPFLHDAVDESFDALRERLLRDVGWDVLASLESAYTPLTSSLDPGRGQDWLFTGRAFALNPLTARAGWILTLREDLNGQTYWRVYVRPVAQDGSVGQPLRERPWDLNARYSLNPRAYEQGGDYAEAIPTGYWVDFTALAREFGWQRQPALPNWRSFFKGTRFNQFVLTGGLDWRTAMLQLYPPDIFVTPTVVVPPTKTPTITPTGYRYKTPTPTVTDTPTMRPTFTQAP